MSGTQYIVYGHESSYFTMKLVAAFRLCGVACTLQHVTTDNAQHLKERSGTHRIPVLELVPQDWIVADTTYIMRALLPQLYGSDGSSRGLISMLEEFFDEYMPRAAVCQRWMIPENVETAVKRICQASLPHDMSQSEREAKTEQLVPAIKMWGPKSCRALGVSEPHQRDACLAELDRVFSIVERCLVSGRYILGSMWPTAVDAVVLGSLRAHFFHDVRGLDPARFPKLHKLCVRVFEGPEMEPPPGVSSPIVLESVLVHELMRDEAMRNFVLITRANGVALHAKQKSFVVHINGSPVSILTRQEPYTSWRVLLSTIERDDSVKQLIRLHQLDALLSLPDAAKL